MNDHQIISVLHRFKVAAGEWVEGVSPSVRELSTALRAMGRLDVAGRVEEGRTVFALRD